MARESPNQKRKRGRPAGASEAKSGASTRGASKRNVTEVEESASIEQHTGEDDRPKKRSRRNNTSEAASEKAPTATAQSHETRTHSATDRTGSIAPKPKKGENTARRESGEQAEDGEGSNPPPRRSKRDRNSGDGTPWWEVSGISDPSSQPEEVNIAGPSRPRKPGRSSLKEVSVLEAQNKPLATTTGHSGVKKRGRPSLQMEPAEESSNLPSETTLKNTEPKRGEKPRRSEVAPEQSRSKRSSTGSSIPSRSIPKKSTGVQRGKRRSNNSQEEASRKAEASGSGLNEAPPDQKYRHMEPRVRHVPRSAIASKWGHLDSGAIAAAVDLLTNVERPVLGSLRDTGRRREYARSALSFVSHRLHTKLIKGMPFPPASAAARSTSGGVKSGHEDELNFDRTVASIQTLEGQLNPLLHAVAILQREKEKEEQALEKDYASFKTLETNARAEARTWRERMKRSHALAPEVAKEDQSTDAGVDKLNILHTSDNGARGIFQNVQDKQLATLSSQIGSHMDSMKGNLQQIEGIVPAIVKGKASLQEVFEKHLDNRRYQQVLLG